MIEGIQYLFIDGDYFKRACADVFAPVFAVEPEIDFAKMEAQLGCQKAFYYGCIDDAPRPGEDEATRQARVEAQEREYQLIQAVPGFHVQFGTLVGTRPGRLRQKEVDVQLAVDMLFHAAAKNIQSATLVAGDLDFRPVVRALVQFGIYVRLCHEVRSVSKDLLWASDEGLKLSVESVHGWSTGQFQTRHPMPYSVEMVAPPVVALAHRRPGICRCGQLRASEVEAWFTQVDQQHHIVLAEAPDRWLYFSNADFDVLERFVALKRGTILWR